MASTTRTRPNTVAARKRAAPRPAPALADDLDEFEPIHIPADEDVVEERVPLFYIGEDEYTIPKEIPPGYALEYLRVAAQVGEQLAAPTLLTRVLGEDAYMALETSRGLKEKQLTQIIDLIVKRALGSSEKEGKDRTA